MTNRNPKQHLCFFLDSPFWSGAENQVEANILSLANEHEISVFLFGGAKFVSEARQRFEGKVSRVIFYITGSPKRSNRGALTLHGLWTVATSALWSYRNLKGSQCSLVHVNNGGYPGSNSARGFALGALVGCKARTLMTVNNMAVPRSQSLARVLDWPIDKALASSRLEWINGSQAASLQLEKVLGVAGKKRHVIPNGVALPACGCGPFRDCKLTPSIDPHEVLFLSIGHLEARKGHDVLIMAVAALRDSSEDMKKWQFVLEGNGPLEMQLQEHVLRLGLSGIITFIGRATCLYGLYSRADVLVHPSLSHEDLPNVISEALGFGIPVIASSIAGIPEQIDSSIDGILVEPGHHLALARAISLLGSASAIREKMGKAAKDKFETKFTQPLALARYRELYQLNEGSSRD